MRWHVTGDRLARPAPRPSVHARRQGNGKWSNTQQCWEGMHDYLVRVHCECLPDAELEHVHLLHGSPLFLAPL